VTAIVNKQDTIHKSNKKQLSNIATSALHTTVLETMSRTKANEHGLDLELVIKEFQASHPEDDVMLDHYNVAFSEIARFFEVMGPLFGFVAKDVREKVGVIEHHKKTRFVEHFESVQSVIAYETGANLTKKKSEDGLPSGSRTILRLHRALEFITELLKKVEYGKDEDHVSSLAGEAYNATLAKYHPWLIRKAAGLAMYSLPSRKKFMATSFQQTAEEAERIIPHFLEISKKVHDTIQRLYSDHDLLMLP